MRITCHGAAGTVTGSKHLIETDAGTNILLDCGIFQGPGSDGKNETLPFGADSVHAVVLSHAHADHIAMLPVLVASGFSGRIFSTPATRDVAELILLDSAHIAVEDAAFRRKKRIGTPASWTPRYTPADIPAVMERFATVSYARDDDRWHAIAPDVRCRLFDAGHILGSSIPVLAIGGAQGSRHIAFSGDLGPPDMPILQDPEVPGGPIDIVLLESTYGDEIHTGFTTAVDQLIDTIARTAQRRGKVVVPAFSLGRTQLLVYLIHRAMDVGRIPRIPIIVDSPLASEITTVFTKHRSGYDRETRADFPGAGHVPLSFDQLTYTTSIEDSKRVNALDGPLVIISASGMMTSGRVIHHLRHTIADARNTILITGFQAEGTTGRALEHGAPEVELHGEIFPVRAEIVAFDAFSAHADQHQLLSWLEAVPGVGHVILVHGEPHARNALAAQIAKRHPDWRIDLPSEGEVITA